MCAAVEHAYILVWNNVYSVIINVAQLNEVRFECKDPWVAKSKALWCAFPVNPPFRSGSPTVSVNKEREFRVIEQKFAVEALNMDRFNAFLASDKIERCVCLMK